MHTAAGSWWDEFIAPGNYLLYPQPTQSVTWLPVDQDQPLVKLYRAREPSSPCRQAHG